MCRSVSRGISDPSVLSCMDGNKNVVNIFKKVKAMVTGRDRRPHLGIKLALECRRNIIYPMKNKNSKFNNQPVNPDGTLVNKEGTV